MMANNRAGSSRRARDHDSADEAELSQNGRARTLTPPVRARKGGPSRGDASNGGDENGAAEDEMTGWTVSDYQPRPTLGTHDNQRQVSLLN